MFRFTKENAKALGSKGGKSTQIRRKQPKPLPLSVAPQAASPVLAVMEQSYEAVTKIGGLILRTRSPARLDLFTRSYERVWRIYAEIAGVPERAKRRPPTERDQGRAVPIDASPMGDASPAGPAEPGGPASNIRTADVGQAGEREASSSSSGTVEPAPMGAAEPAPAPEPDREPLYFDPNPNR